LTQIEHHQIRSDGLDDLFQSGFHDLGWRQAGADPAAERVELVQLLDALLQGPFRLPTSPSHLLCLLQFSFDSRGQARQGILHHVIVSPSLHRRHCGLLANSSGYQDERQVGAAIPQQLQGRHPAKTRQLVIGDDHVPHLTGQRRAHRIGRFDPFHDGVETPLVQLPLDQKGVMFRVFNE